MASRASSEAPQHPTQHKVVSWKVYAAILVSLLVLTIITVLVAGVHLGAFNTAVALGIAVLKAALVVLFFMNMRHSTPLLRMAAIAAFVWFGIMIAFTMSDFVSRDWVNIAAPRAIGPAFSDAPEVPASSTTPVPGAPPGQATSPRQ